MGFPFHYVKYRCRQPSIPYADASIDEFCPVSSLKCPSIRFRNNDLIQIRVLIYCDNDVVSSTVHAFDEGGKNFMML
ncbi:hypothetical protein GJ496_006684 [Pomphorhynchus laevis]|nr:hypothetical protein GJ496_006684 [Pomphorhynchus laevis]